ncbi:MAG: hypothetical protein P8Y44_11055 [Acidobacteriota bacterium]
MRLLVLDGSRVLPSLVRRMVPPGTDIVEAGSFERALDQLKLDPPDAVIVNVTPVDLPWQEIKTYCQEQEPKIPVLFESCVYAGPIDAGLDTLNHTSWFLPKPYSMEDLRMALRLLVTWVEKRESKSPAEPQ